MADVIPLMYNHPQSRPKLKFPDTCIPPSAKRASGSSETTVETDTASTAASGVSTDAGGAKRKKGPETHVEVADFDGDRVLSNSILFMMEFGWWTENYAIPEGDIGRVIVIFKIYIFTFAGKANQNYMCYMLDLYALLEYECSPALKHTLLSNYLLNRFAEWSNKWIIGTAKKRGGEFDDKYFRKTIAPNARHFLEIKEDVESASDLKRRSKSHTSPHLRDETKILLRMYKEEELHSLHSGRSMGHAAVNRFDRGYQRLEGGKLSDYLKKSKEFASVLATTEKLRRLVDGQTMNVDSSSSPPPPPDLQALTPSNPTLQPLPHPFAPTILCTASRAASDAVQEWDEEDHSNDKLTSGSDLTVTTDPGNGQMSGDWYEEHEFPEALMNMNEDEVHNSDDEDDLPPSKDVDSDDSGEE
ncbi:hypothetical protein R3P38DRAFT_3244175 [Favolaschia claudopus]|uniref:DUF6589 domain-containing protein n=1 Tax=Favolaschia claudopus TaxID=2862362 RepID=A0AAV9Z1X3_9AGAR